MVNGTVHHLGLTGAVAVLFDVSKSFLQYHLQSDTGFTEVQVGSEQKQFWVAED